jgi:5-methylthioadenosine/S-adenosylhomocysteine deaminase
MQRDFCVTTLVPPEHASRTTLIEDARILHIEADGTCSLRRGTLCVTGDTIADIDDTALLRERYPDATRIAARGRIAMPGLVDAHVHPDLHILRGSVEERGLHEWSGARHFDAALHLLGSAEGCALQRASIRASLAEAALAGTTCVGTYGVTDGALESCADALAAIGLRGAVTARDESFARADEPRRREPFDYPVFYRLHAEEALFEDELERAADAHRRGGRIVMHAAETEHRCELVRARFGTTTVRLLDRYGLLSPRVVLSHLTFVDDEEIALLARRGAVVVFSAAAEMKLGDGTPPAITMLRAGVNAGLGTDAAVCSNSTDMFIEMRMFAMQQKLRYGARAVSAGRILRMATADGAAVLGLTGIGRLAPGWAADLTLIDAYSPRMLPLAADHGWNNIASNLVFSATGADVTDVMVAGRWIVRRRRLTMASARAIRFDLIRAARTLHRRLKRTR